MASRTAFGADTLEDCADDDAAVNLVTAAYEAGINFFDTSRSFPESERRLGLAFQRTRQNVMLATKSSASTAAELQRDLEESLNALQTDYIDLFQYDAGSSSALPAKQDQVYKCLLGLKKDGRVRHIGIASEDDSVISSALDDPLYETLQFPFSIASSEFSIKLVEECRRRELGVLAMQPLCGGVVRNIPLAFGYLHQWENVVALWGAATIEELQQILYFESHPPVIDEQFKKEAENIRNFFN
jgi:aryl-alcohol dehydrogenase-like predicted oxidoreductase